MLGRQGCNLKLSKRQSQARFSLFLLSLFPSPSPSSPPAAFNPWVAEDNLASFICLDSPSPPLSAEGTKRAALPGDVRAAETPIPPCLRPSPPGRRCGEEGALLAVLRGGTARTAAPGTIGVYRSVSEGKPGSELKNSPSGASGRCPL